MWHGTLGSLCTNSSSNKSAISAICKAVYAEGILWLAMAQKFGRLYVGPAHEDLFLTDED